MKKNSTNIAFKKLNTNKPFDSASIKSEIDIKTCMLCGEASVIRLHESRIVLCKTCGLHLFKLLSHEYVPRAIENVVLRAERQFKNSKKQLDEKI